MKEGNALYVFAGSIGALWLMTALSAAGGVVLPALLSPQVTHAIMIFMLAVFGLKMLYEGLTMEDSGQTLVLFLLVLLLLAERVWGLLNLRLCHVSLDP